MSDDGQMIVIKHAYATGELKAIVEPVDTALKTQLSWMVDAMLEDPSFSIREDRQHDLVVSFIERPEGEPVAVVDERDDLIEEAFSCIALEMVKSNSPATLHGWWSTIHGCDWIGKDLGDHLVRIGRFEERAGGGGRDRFYRSIKAREDDR